MSSRKQGAVNAPPCLSIRLMAIRPAIFRLLLGVACHPEGVSSSAIANYIGQKRSTVNSQLLELVGKNLIGKVILPDTVNKSHPTFIYSLAKDIDLGELLLIAKGINHQDCKELVKEIELVYVRETTPAVATVTTAAAPDRSNDPEPPASLEQADPQAAKQDLGVPFEDQVREVLVALTKKVCQLQEQIAGLEAEHLDLQDQLLQLKGESQSTTADLANYAQLQRRIDLSGLVESIRF